MAKRRKLEAPSQEDLSKFEEEFRRETGLSRSSPPIAQVVADTAATFVAQGPDERALQIRNEKEAGLFRKAQSEGRVILDLPIDEIDPDALPRDRTTIDLDAQSELVHSINASGLRLPIEVFELPNPTDRLRYGLISGFRRLHAQRTLAMQPDGSEFATIKAILRPREQLAGAHYI